jgi:LysM repeat protein
MRRLTAYFVWMGCLVVLTACYRDAGEDRQTTQVEVQDLAPLSATPTPSATLQDVPTFTPPPVTSPTQTFAPGGPVVQTSPAPTLAETSSPTATPETSAETPSNSTLPPTLQIPSFTPAGGSTTFGDSGITPTSNPATQPIPGGLITPTAFLEERTLECIHVVQAGETLTRIALQYEVTTEEMVAANPVLASDINALQVNQELWIPGCATPTPTGGAVVVSPNAPPLTLTGTPPTPTAAVAGQQTHTVQQGENLFRIALQYSTTVDDIKAANPELGGSDLIYPGQVLIIPGP